jgi:cytochrome c oxidase subunit 2
MTDPVTSIAHKVRGNALFITVMVLPFLILPQALLLAAMIKFKKRPGAKPATFHENVKLEVIWTVIPAAVLVALAIPSYSIIKYMETPPPADVRVEIVGAQYQWEYKYLTHGDVQTANEPMVIPENANIVASITSKDVNHAWWVPAFGVKMDAVAGRLNEIWFNVEKTGWYKGQCAELCGPAHAAMLIDVYVVTQEEFDNWIAMKIEEMEGPASEEGEEDGAVEEAEEVVAMLP